MSSPVGTAEFSRTHFSRADKLLISYPEPASVDLVESSRAAGSPTSPAFGLVGVEERRQRCEPGAQAPGKVGNFPSRVSGDKTPIASDETSAGGAKELSPALQRWVEWE